MGSEHSDTVRTLYIDQASWVRTDHRSGRYIRFETAKSGVPGGEPLGREPVPLLLVDFSNLRLLPALHAPPVAYVNLVTVAYTSVTGLEMPLGSVLDVPMVGDMYSSYSC